MVKIIREVWNDLNSNSIDLEKAGETFEEYGFIRNEFLNDERFALLCDEQDYSEDDKCLILRWYAGQLMAIEHQNAFFAVNSWINTIDRFSPKEWL